MPVELQTVSNVAGLPNQETVAEWGSVFLANPKLCVPPDADFELSEDVVERNKLDLCVRLVDEDEGRALNNQFRQIDKATNVLSFSMDTELPAQVDEPRSLGDLVICVPVVAREAQAQGKTLQDHLIHLILHGLLHLFGHDHQTDTEAVLMEGLEVSLLADMGLADPYRVSHSELAS